MVDEMNIQNESAKICYVVTIDVTFQAFFIPQLQWLQAQGFDVTACCCDSQNIKEQLGENIHFAPIYIPRGVSWVGSIRAIIMLYQFFRKSHFDMIQYSTPNAAFCASIASYLARCRIRNYHLMGYRYLGAKGYKRMILKCLEKISCILSTHVECVSESTRALGIDEKLFVSSKAVIVGNGSSGGIDLQRFDITQAEQWRTELRNHYHISSQAYVCAFVGRITHDKGINELLRAFNALSVETILFLIGSKEGIHTLDPILWETALNNPQIILVDQTQQIEKYYAMMDVLILPSHREGCGNVAIEAEAMGVPVIVSDIPGARDTIIHHHTGLLVPQGHCKALSDAIEMLSQPAIRKRMEKNAHKFARMHFDENILLPQIVQRKRKLVEERR